MTQVVWLTPSFPWQGDPMGGLFFATQARAIARLGVRIDVVAPTPMAPWPLPRLRQKWQRYATSPHRQTVDGVVVHRPRYLNVPAQPRWAVPDREIARSAATTRREWPGAQLIHGHDALVGIAAWRLSRRVGLPFVLTFHGSDMNTWPDAHPDRLPALREAATRASAVFAVSGALADRVRDVTGVDAIHLPIGVDRARLAAARIPRDQARRDLGFTDDQIVALFVGNLLPSKGSPVLADAILRLDDRFRAVFLGAGPALGHGTEDERARGRLRYVGVRPHDDVILYMSASDILVLPSMSEGLPTVIMEAGAVGLSVIASRVGGIPELLEGDRGIIIERPAVEDVAAALGTFALDRAAAQRRVVRLQDHIEASYDVEKLAARLVETYRSIVRSTPVNVEDGERLGSPLRTESQRKDPA